MRKPLSSRHAKRRKNTRMRKLRARRLLGGIYTHPEHMADHLAICSCPACGNPRRHFSQRTLAELRAIDAEHSQLMAL